MYKIAVIGTGYVGLTTSIGLANLGHKVTGYDIDSAKVEMLKAGQLPIYEPGLDEILADVLAAGNLIATSELSEAVAEAARVRLAAEAAAAEAAERTRLEALAAAEAAKKVRLAAEALAAEQAQARAAAAAAAAEADRLAKAAIQAAKDLLAREQAKVIALPAKGIAYKTKKTRDAHWATLQHVIDGFFRLLELLIVVLMVAMVVMVFGNVVLRYGFNSGISISDEMSRYCFIWLTYIGAMVAMREGGHLGVDTLVKHLSLGGKKFCLFLSESLMLYCNGLFLLGTWKMHDLQVTNVSPVVGISMIWIYGVGYVTASVMAVMNINQLVLLLTGRLKEEDLVMVVASVMWPMLQLR
mgnify:CR=1 FL=1